MKNQKFIFSMTVCLLFSASAYGQFGTVDVTNTVESEILEREMPYSVYLPESYHTSNRNYPVLYLLHGMTDDYHGWVSRGEVHKIAGNAMAGNNVPEMIIIMPDGLYDGFYINNYDGSIRWEDFFHEEFIPEIENRYRVIGNRNTRAIAGLSMGGYGAMYHGVKYKEKFSAIYAMSGAFLEVEPMPDEERSDWEREFHHNTWGPYNDEGLPEKFEEHSIQEIFKAMEPIEPTAGQWQPFGNDDVPLPRIFIDCGDDDFLLEENMNLVNIMNSRNILFEFRVRDGGHTWDYWRTSLKKTLIFMGEVFLN